MTLDAETRPLGIRPEVSLTEDQLRALRTLEEYDLTPVRNRLMNDGGMPPGWVDEALLEFRRFLGLQVIAPSPRIMFSRHIDHVWHTCLLFSRLYADYCQQTFGFFFHHDPTTGPRPDPEPQFREFERLYESVYGDMNRLWYMRR
jgi:hypothetical protein